MPTAAASDPEQEVPFLPPRPRTPEDQLDQLARVLTSAAAGDFTERLDLPESDDTLEDRVVLLSRFLLDELQQAQEARTREVQRLREIDLMKGRFINTAAHELGTPLTPIKVQVSLLSSGRLGALDAAQQRAVRIVERNLDRVIALVGDLLAISRMEAGELRLRKSRIDVRDLVREAFESFDDAAAQRGIRLEMEADESLAIDGDPGRLGQALYNLVNNAMKFTPRGGRVVVRARRRGSEALVQVQDTGIGLAADDIARLANPFVKLAESPHGDPGTGLGLYITKGLVERHGGLLWIESAGQGLGTTVSMAIPLATTVADGAAPIAETGAGAPSTP